MRGILKFVAILAAIIIGIMLHLGALYVLPFPFSQVHLLFVLLFLLLIITESGLVVWVSFFAHFIIELFSATPFGVLLFSGTISVLFMYWLSKEMFTHRSWISAVTLCAIGILGYRLIYVFAMLLQKFLFSFQFEFIFEPFLWEVLFTTVLVACIYPVLPIFLKKLQPRG